MTDPIYCLGACLYCLALWFIGLSIYCLMWLWAAKYDYDHPEDAETDA